MALGDPSPKELTCLANLREWEQGLEFDRQFRGGDALKPVECAVTIRTTGWKPVLPEREEIKGEVGRSDADPVREVSSFSDPGGIPALKEPKPKPKRLPAWWKNASRAVQKDWLRDHEGRQ